MCFMNSLPFSQGDPANLPSRLGFQISICSQDCVIIKHEYLRCKKQMSELPAAVDLVFLYLFASKPNCPEHENVVIQKYEIFFPELSWNVPLKLVDRTLKTVLFVYVRIEKQVEVKHFSFPLSQKTTKDEG